MKEHKPLRTLIIDDSPQARQLMKMMLQELLSDEVLLLGELQDANEALSKIQTLGPDVVLLDIEMPGKNGIRLAQELVGAKINCEVIFTTAYSEYAIQAFRLSAIDYLLKPIKEDDLIEALQKVKQKKALIAQSQKRLETLAQNLQPEEEKTLCLHTGSAYEYLKIAEIEYLKAEGSYVKVALYPPKQHIISKNLKHFENLLEGFEDFVRVHRSFIINQKYIKGYKKGANSQLIMQSDAVIDVARNSRHLLDELIAKKGTIR